MTVIMLGLHEADEVADVLGEAFGDYPVMQFVLADSVDREGDLRSLVEFFVASRALRGQPMLGIRDGRLLAAVTTITPPGSAPSPPALASIREALWSRLGPAARDRYEAYGAAAGRLFPSEPHHHLNMIGVRRSHMGRGLARILLDASYDLAASDPRSAGISLNTELRANVGLYEHLGYVECGHATVSPQLETWALYRAIRRD